MAGKTESAAKLYRNLQSFLTEKNEEENFLPNVLMVRGKKFYADSGTASNFS